jgi:putative transposase
MGSGQEQKVSQADVDPQWVAGVDLGINNLAALTTSQPGFMPLLVNGRPLKALNQLYNKRRAHYQALLPEGQYTSRRLDGLADKRKRRVDSYLHVASRRIIDHLVQHRIGILVIGKNDGWKQEVALGRRTNQNFVFLPHARFIEMLIYKARLVPTSWDTGDRGRRILYQQVQFPRYGAYRQARDLCWSACDTRAVSL